MSNDWNCVVVFMTGSLLPVEKPAGMFLPLAVIRNVIVADLSMYYVTPLLPATLAVLVIVHPKIAELVSSLNATWNLFRPRCTCSHQLLRHDVHLTELELELYPCVANSLEVTSTTSRPDTVTLVSVL